LTAKSPKVNHCWMTFNMEKNIILTLFQNSLHSTARNYINIKSMYKRKNLLVQITNLQC